MKRLLRCARRAVAAFVCRQNGHLYRLKFADAGPLGTLTWWYCPRCGSSLSESWIIPPVTIHTEDCEHQP